LIDDGLPGGADASGKRDLGQASQAADVSKSLVIVVWHRYEWNRAHCLRHVRIPPKLAQLVHGPSVPSTAFAVKRPPEYRAVITSRFRRLLGSDENAMAGFTEQLRVRSMARTRRTDHFVRFVFTGRFLGQQNSRIL
jgi:hypothetical protein